MKVLIENPHQSGNHLLSLNAAERYVARGRAKWTGDNRIRFIESDYQQAVSHRIFNIDRGYDSRGVLTIKEIAHIPVCSPVKLTTNPTSSKHRADSRHRNGRVRIVIEDGVYVEEMAA